MYSVYRINTFLWVVMTLQGVVMLLRSRSGCNMYAMVLCTCLGLTEVLGANDLVALAVFLAW